MLWFVVGLFIVSAMILNDHGRKILGVIIALILIPIFILWAISESHDSENASRVSSTINDSQTDSGASEQPTEQSTQTPAESADSAFNDKRYVEAFKIYAGMKRHGGGIGLDRMAWMYDSGNGIPQNRAKAFDLYRKSSVLGNNNAQLNLGVFYGSGQSTAQDFMKAYVWSSIAAAGGADGAASNRDSYAASLNPEQLAHAQDVAEKCMKKSLAICDQDFSLPVAPSTDGSQF